MNITGTPRYGEDSYSYKLSSESVREIRRRYNTGESQTKLAAEFGTSQSNINMIVHYQSRRRG